MWDDGEVAFLFLPVGGTAEASSCLLLARELRRLGLACVVDGRPARLRRKMEGSDKVAPHFVAVLGGRELSEGRIAVRDGAGGDWTDVLLGPDAVTDLALLVLSPEQLEASRTRIGVGRFR